MKNHHHIRIPTHSSCRMWASCSEIISTIAKQSVHCDGLLLLACNTLERNQIYALTKNMVTKLKADIGCTLEMSPKLACGSSRVRNNASFLISEFAYTALLAP